MKILLTGGTGYIGSHTAIDLIENGNDIVIVDNLSNSSKEVINRLNKITKTKVPFYEADIRNRSKLEEIFEQEKPDAVIHFAGLKAVGESVEQPLKYYSNNLESSLVLLDVMSKFNVNKIVFSSSATVCGVPKKLPITESDQAGVGITNPYGWTKFMIEQILTDIAAANPDFEVTILRYFNPVGAHKSGLIGEDPNGIPNNLLPYITQVAVGRLAKVGVFGNDYDTPDGTGVRDYIHVMDLASGHTAALNHSKPGVAIYNLCSGKGVSVLELIDAFSKAAGKSIPYEITDRRPGDIAASYADASKAKKELNWQTVYSIEQACADSWKWQSNNPNGFAD